MARRGKKRISIPATGYRQRRTSFPARAVSVLSKPFPIYNYRSPFTYGRRLAVRTASKAIGDFTNANSIKFIVRDKRTKKIKQVRYSPKRGYKGNRFSRTFQTTKGVIAARIRTLVCTRRKIRRSVLFKLLRAGQGKGITTKKRVTLTSKIKC